MSKLHYLLLVLVITIVGYVVVGQLNRATETARELTAQEVIKRISFTVEKAYRQLKRYPDAGEEFRRLVLEQLDLHRYPERIVVEGFIPGNARLPASFHLKVGPPDREVMISLRYYGSDYRVHLEYKGRLEQL